MERRKLAVLGIAVVLLISVAVLPRFYMSGYKFFLSGTAVEADSMNESGEVNSSRHWVQESYEDEIQNLSAMEYYVTQQNGTEPPFKNELYDEKRDGIYVDVVSGEPLFSSKAKFDSGTGWPSFYRPLEPENIIRRKDPGVVGMRIEIASRHARSHLGHVFEHPRTPTGLRYCMNSAALEFIPEDQLEEEGYGQYSSLFDEDQDR